MADQNITELPVKTSSGMTSSDYMLGIDSAEGYQMLIKDLGDYIIRNVQVNTIAGANQTLKSALDTLNSNITMIANIQSGTVTITDLMILKKHIVKLVTLADQGLKNADVDENGTVGVNDLMILKKYIVNLPTSYTW
jgi:hypothetical protein